MAPRDSDISRRSFISKIPAAAMFLTAHELLARTAPGSAASRSRGPDPGAEPVEPLIRSIDLCTATPLDALKRFYRDGVGFRVLDERADAIRFAAGTTRLTFSKIGPAEIHGDGARGQGEPFYHFAFNIPRNKLRAARSWQLERSALVPPRPDLRDPDWPDDVWHFRHWNAHSVFFFDPAFNIVEYIARHDLRNDSADPATFSTADILYASEIGYVFDRADQPQATRMLHEGLGLEPYPRGIEPWWAMGDERGLILCLGRKGELWAENTATPVKWDVFPTAAAVRGAAPKTHEFPGFPYRLTVE